jgi:hypothetical protein
VLLDVEGLGSLRLSVPVVVMGLRGSGWEGPAVVSFIDLLPIDCTESDGVRLWDFVERGAILGNWRESKETEGI